MAHKSKQVVWHKKTGKFIPSKFLKPREKTEKEKNLEHQKPQRQDRMNNFFQKLKEEIRKAL